VIMKTFTVTRLARTAGGAASAMYTCTAHSTPRYLFAGRQWCITSSIGCSCGATAYRHGHGCEAYPKAHQHSACMHAEAMCQRCRQSHHVHHVPKHAGVLKARAESTGTASEGKGTQGMRISGLRDRVGRHGDSMSSTYHPATDHHVRRRPGSRCSKCNHNVQGQTRCSKQCHRWHTIRRRRGTGHKM
jgi:hypothetical protein